MPCNDTNCLFIKFITKKLQNSLRAELLRKELNIHNALFHDTSQFVYNACIRYIYLDDRCSQFSLFTKYIFFIRALMSGDHSSLCFKVCNRYTYLDARCSGESRRSGWADGSWRSRRSGCAVITTLTLNTNG